MSETTPTAEQVVKYLSEHPEFFSQHTLLLEELTLPHESGNAISLVERQVSVLRERNMDMRHRLSKLLDNARDNDRLFEKTKRLVLKLLEAQSTDECLSSLTESFQHHFNIHYTSIILFDNSPTRTSQAARVVSIEQAQKHIAALLKSNKAQCGTFSTGENIFLFPEFGDSVGSAALTPLVKGNTFGVLAIGNRDPSYYRSSMGTLFLSYIGEVLSRVLPKFTS